MANNQSRIETSSLNFPSNTHKEKETTKEEKKPEKVIKGNVSMRKKSIGNKFMSTFVGEDVENVKDYILKDVLIPSAKDVLMDILQGTGDIFKGSIEAILFPGQERSRSSRRGRDRGRTYVSYDRISSRDKERERERDRRDRREISNRSRANHNFDDILFETKADALEVRDHLVDLIDQYGEATVASLYDAVGITQEFTDRTYGWENLSHARVTRVPDGWILDLPKPILLD